MVSAATPAGAAEGPWASHDTAKARLVAAIEATGTLETVPAGLHVVLADGWKTYWRSPGDAGAPPSVDWSASENVKKVEFRWPAPHRFTLFGLETFGYAEEVVFPLDVALERPGEPTALRGKADILVCSNICVPVVLDLALDLPAGGAAADPEAGNLIARFQAAIPDDGTHSGLRVEGAILEPGRPGTLAVSIVSDRPLQEPDVLLESRDWTFGRPELSFAPDGRRVTARLPIGAGPDAVSMPGSSITATVTDGPRAAEFRLTVAAAPAGALPRIGPLVTTLGIALLGGLVLNLMPCVLPVLSLKLMSVIGHRDRERRRIRLGFLATAAGIVASMLVMAGALVGLKAAGMAVGWGVQFQQPVFLVLMAAVLVVFALGLAGGPEIPLPSRVASVLGHAGGDGLGGNVAAGAFATLLATPCSAPFVGTAVAFALARGPAEILAIFTALGLGLAAPYLLVSAFPRLTGLLPRPGRWMMMLRRLLALALLGTAAWLLSVLAAQTSWPSSAAVAAALFVLAAALLFRSRLGRAAAVLTAVTALSGALAAPVVLDAATRTLSPPAASSAAKWTRFDQAEIGRLVAQGRTVFVDVTADWCITCKANKSLVLDRPEVAAALTADGVVPMRADWTRPDARISDYLARHDRYGIPFNAVYGPGAPRGIVLPEILSNGAVLDALAQARGGGS
ncbi:copper resistance protein [Azospirillum sp. B21]|nr:copper resistance protein [Azospirillum sp. B21]